jgi:hypothetical protein
LSDDDILTDEHGNTYRKWSCPDCSGKTNVYLHIDPDHQSNAWHPDFVREHDYVHERHLEHHGGDRGVMRLALKYPALHAAIIQVHGPISGLTSEHRAQILLRAGIDEGNES